MQIPRFLDKDEKKHSRKIPEFTINKSIFNLINHLFQEIIFMCTKECKVETCIHTEAHLLKKGSIDSQKEFILGFQKNFAKKPKIKNKICKCTYPECYKEYTNLYRLKIHMRTHIGHKPFSCSYCEKKFNEKGNLKIHNRIHTGDKPFHCDFAKCTSKFRTFGQLKDHKDVHYNIKLFKCEICHIYFSRKWTLGKHQKTHNAKENTCINILQEYEIKKCETKAENGSSKLNSSERNENTISDVTIPELNSREFSGGINYSTFYNYANDNLQNNRKTKNYNDNLHNDYYVDFIID